MDPAIEEVARRSLARECVINAAAATGLVGGGGLITLAGLSFVIWAASAA